MIGDDIAGLLGKGGGGDYGFRQGTVLTYNVLSGSNTISVAGTVLTDVPFLNPGGYTIYQPGDVVILIRMRSSWAILGRVTIPTGTKAIGRYTELSAAYSSGGSTNYSLTTGVVTKDTLTIPVPSWAEVATVSATALVFAKNSTGATDFLNCQLSIGGFAVTWTSASVPTLAWASMTVTSHEDLLVTPGGTLTITAGLFATGAAWAANALNSVSLEAAVAWTSANGS